MLFRFIYLSYLIFGLLFWLIVPAIYFFHLDQFVLKELTNLISFSISETSRKGFLFDYVFLFASLPILSTFIIFIDSELHRLNQEIKEIKELFANR